MKFYDKRGRVYNSLLKAIFNDVKDSIIERSHTVYKPHKPIENPVIVSYDEFAHDVMMEHEKINHDETVSEEPEEPKSSNRFEELIPDYAHNRIIVYDDNGNETMSVPMDESLSKVTVDRELMSILYPDGNIPDELRSSVGAPSAGTDVLTMSKETSIGDFQCRCGNIKVYSEEKGSTECDSCGTKTDCEICGTVPEYPLVEEGPVG